MDQTQVIKVKFNGAMCRISAAKAANENVITFSSLEDRVRSSFKLNAADVISLTYTDVDGDVINLSSDQDIVDAMLYQRLNPLRLDLHVERAFADVAALVTSSSSGLISLNAVPASPSPGSASISSESGRSEATEKTQKLGSGTVLSAETGAVVTEPELQDPAEAAASLEAALKGGLSPPGTALPSSSSGVAASLPPASVNTPHVNPVHTVKDGGSVAEVNYAEQNMPAAMTTLAASHGLKSLLEPVVLPATKPAAAAASAADPASAAVSPAAHHAAAPVVHSSIICDLCEMNPIVGLRYKSLQKHNYDLCEGCFKKTNGSLADYRCYDTPAPRPAPRHGVPAFRGAAWGGPCQPGSRSMRWAPPGQPGFGGRSFHGRPGPAPAASFGERKLDARFIADVTIPDSMEMLPGTRFTKIWKLRNTGGMSWPATTQIVHIGGDALGERNAVKLQIPQWGVQPGEEVDVCVDMVAPMRLGRYTSHWRLNAPARGPDRVPGFGHRVWALIQVVSPDKFPSGTAPAFFPLLARSGALTALPSMETERAGAAAFRASREEKAAGAAEGAAAGSPSPAGREAEAGMDPIIAAVLAAGPPAPVAEDSGDEKGKAVEAEAVPVHPSSASQGAISPAEVGAAIAAVSDELVKLDTSPVVEPAPAASFELSAASVENTGVGNFSLVDAPPVKATDSSSDTASVDGYVDAGCGSENSAPNGKAAKADNLAAEASKVMFPNEDEEDSEVLDQLEGMGFEDRELNREALKGAKGKVVDAIDALMKTAEWDPILEELEEMGFEDKMLNKRMMFKNAGDVKGAVKDIVHFYKQQ